MSSLYRRGRIWWYKARGVQQSLKTTDRAVARLKQYALDERLGTGKRIHGQVSFAEARTAYLAHLGTSVTPMHVYTQGKYLSVWERVLACPLRQLGRPQVEAGLARLTEERHLRPRTRNHYLSTMRSFLRWCRERYYLLYDATSGIPMTPAMPQERTWLTKAQRDQVLAMAKDSPHRLLINAAFYTGLRWNELANLSWEDVNLEAGILRVRAKFAKTRRDRVVPIHPKLAGLLKAARQPAGPCFGLQNRLTYKAQLSSLRKWLKAVGVKGDRLGLHTARHTFISLLLQEGRSIWKVSGWAGHADVKVTNDRYAHHAKTYDEDIAV